MRIPIADLLRNLYANNPGSISPGQLIVPVYGYDHNYALVANDPPEHDQASSLKSGVVPGVGKGCCGVNPVVPLGSLIRRHFSTIGRVWTMWKQFGVD
jgi:hypothetical protein